jgi:peptidoglycan-associated lipoprotein
MGVAEARIDTLSFGEEKPLNLGHDEMAWSQNRRDDFVIVK